MARGGQHNNVNRFQPLTPSVSTDLHRYKLLSQMALFRSPRPTILQLESGPDATTWSRLGSSTLFQKR
ncbi:hypothetical protein CK203_090494 [Vitis vinifera]|uniref:Uncharacterized protein n=1 Tax=Vitis vinifera TaxID=29760 RepID=A0A438BTW2_VITVI|nr:hypothetical protein CK203_090494 [Vitis vinifera]